MDPKFHPELSLKSGGQTIAAGGPCNWQDGDAWAEVKDVTVMQGSVVASSGGSTTVRRESDQGWSLEVSSSGQLTPGPARARAIVFVRRKDGTTYQYPWSVDVQLVQLDAPLELDDIQGNILAGFNKDYTSYLLFALPNEQAQARRWLAGLVDQVATTQEVKQFNDLFRAIRSRRGREGVVEATWMNLAFTHDGLEKLGLPQHELNRFPDEFRQGMRNRAELIGDVGDNDPSQWPNGLGTETIHALMVVAADSDEDRKREVEYFARYAESYGLTLVFRQDGVTRREARDREHFGFRDGISQPGIRGLTAPSDPSKPDEGEPGQALIAPGEFVLGHPLQGPLAASSVPYPPTPADDPSNPQQEWTRNGSYLVFRRLQQDVKGFWDFVTTQAPKQRQSVDLFAAKLVGRYPSGAPLEGADDATEDPGRTDPDAVLQKSKINTFAYSTDPDGMQVPRAAHIRKSHPRAQEPPGEQEGRRRRILRRGIPFGDSFDPDSPPDSASGADPQFPNDRGLCFVCYQRSIRDQFEFIQHEWANKDSVPEPGDGVDPVASQASQSSPERLFRLPGGAVDPVRLPKQWVTTTGGEYFFSPSISALERLSRR
jgi:Dyp-type peroxidase family